MLVLVLADIPVPGSTRGRLVEASLYLFERDGYEATSVTDVAAKASVTTGALYHHFGSKYGLYQYVRADLEKRLTERMAGAAESNGGSGPAAVRAALLVAFDAAVRFGAPRIVGEPYPVPGGEPDSTPTDAIETALAPVVTADLRPAARLLTAAWRAALLAVAEGVPVSQVRPALESLVPGAAG